MSNLLEVKEEEFANIIAEGVVLVDFWATWCGPCRTLAPILEQVDAELDGAAKIAKVNIEDCKALAAQYMVRSIPTLLIFKNGEVVDQMVGVQSKARLLEAIQSKL